MTECRICEFYEEIKDCEKGYCYFNPPAVIFTVIKNPFTSIHNCDKDQYRPVVEEKDWCGRFKKCEWKISALRAKNTDAFIVEVVDPLL